MDTGEAQQQRLDAQDELSSEQVSLPSSFLDEHDDRVYLNMHVHARSLVGRLGDYTDPEEDSKLWSVEEYSRRQYPSLSQTENAETDASVGIPRPGRGPINIIVGNGSTELSFPQMIDRQLILSSLLNDHVLVLQHVPHTDDPTKAHVCGMFGCTSIQPNVYRLSLKAGDRTSNVRMVYDKQLFCMKCIRMLFGDSAQL